ncbi:MAG: hypothetical protein Q9180_003880 [Flavoplaca navasiana]
MLKSLGKNGKDKHQDADDSNQPTVDSFASLARHNTGHPRRTFRKFSSFSNPRGSPASSSPKRPVLQHRSTTSGIYPTSDPESAIALIGSAYSEQDTSQSIPARSAPAHSLPPSPNHRSCGSHQLQVADNSLALGQRQLQPTTSDPKYWDSPPSPPSRPPPPPPTNSSQPGLLEQQSPLSQLTSSIASSFQQHPTTASMNPNFLAPAAPAAASITKAKERTMRIAQEQQQALAARLKKNNLEMPPFEFLELIGKGAFGRVFKANDLTRKKVVALKVVDVDPHDFKVHFLEKDESIQTVLHEIKILTQLRDSNAKNINLIIDAFPIHSQLWIVTEYCPGGSLHTLMQGVGSKLEEKYIVPVARELAVALEAIHAAGIIHRDVKAANVMIHENGSLQLIDFGVSGLLQTGKDKRSTIIGTPHWMPPEMSSQLLNQGPSTIGYGNEVDVWAYGCTLYEIATGNPPYHRAEPGRKLTMMLKRSAPTLREKDFSDGLVDLVNYIMKSLPQERPSMKDVLRHNYLFDTEMEFPTRSLANLVKIYYRWEYSGGQRASLFMPGGAEAAAFPTLADNDEQWNFSTTVNFDAQNSDPYLGDQQNVPSTLDLDFDFDDGSTLPRANGNTSKPLKPPISTLHKPTSSLNMSFSMSGVPDTSDKATSMDRKENAGTGGVEHAAKGNIERGEKSLASIFDPNAPDYQYGEAARFEDSANLTPTTPKLEVNKPTLDRSKSDLPLRNATSGLAVHKEVDKSGFMKTPSIDLANVNTIKANRINSRSGQSQEKLSMSDNEGSSKDFAESSKRATMEWTFAAAQQTPVETTLPARPAQRGTLEWSFATAGSVPEEEPVREVPPIRPPLRHQATAPIGVHDTRPSSVLDMDALLYPSDSSFDDSSAFNTAAPSDDESYAAYDLSDAQGPVEEIDPLDIPVEEDEDDEILEAHPQSSLMAPMKLKAKMGKALVRHYEIDPELAEEIIFGDAADPHDLTHGNETFAEECVEAWMERKFPRKPMHLKMALRRDIMDARLEVFAKYLRGNYPFERYVTKYDNEWIDRVYTSSGEDTEDEGEATEREDEKQDPMPKLRNFNVSALEPGASDEALEGELKSQVDQYVNTVLPFVQRKLEKMKTEVEAQDDGDEEDGDAEVDDGGQGDDEAGDEA